MQLYSEHSDGTSPSSNNLAGEHTKNGHRLEASNARSEQGPNPLLSELEEILKPDHLRMLFEKSGISPEVMEARRYRTVNAKADFRQLGFSGAQQNPPGLLIPVYSSSGEIATYQYRPDQPRVGKDGKPVKYETPRGSRMVLDVHPLVREMLGDPSIPLFITEGIKKGDALVSRGLCAVNLLGVWNWRGTNAHGGKVALPEWELIALNDRQVYIVFDSDVILKPQVYAALVRLKSFLEVK